MSACIVDEFVIRGTAAAIERMGAVNREKLYKADEYGVLSGEVSLADDVTVRRIRHQRGPHDRLQMTDDELAKTAVSSLGISVKMRLRNLVMDALSRQGD